MPGMAMHRAKKRNPLCLSHEDAGTCMMLTPAAYAERHEHAPTGDGAFESRPSRISAMLKQHYLEYSRRREFVFGVMNTNAAQINLPAALLPMG